MKITTLSYDARTDCMRLSTDGERDITLAMKDYSVRKSLYVQGAQLEGELLEMTLCLEEKALARIKALKTLSYSAKTSKALMGVLTQAGFTPETAKETVLALKKDGYIDEKEFCRRCTEIYIKKGYGPSRIRAELYKKGFTQRMIDYTLENDNTDFTALLRSQMMKKSGKTDYGSVCRYFYSRGYDSALISDVYREIFD